jgi:LAO/AO transport system kinase
LDAFGCDRIIIETVGVGQSELEIADAAHSTVVVLVPESGDGVQAMKAGLMEIGDIFVINKSDRESAELARMALESALELRETDNGCRPPVVSTIALEGKGVDELFLKIEERLAFLVSSGKIEMRRRECIRSKIAGILKTRILEREWRQGQLQRLIEEETTKVLRGASTPYKSAESLFERLGARSDE